MDIFKLLPKTNCRECGYMTCLAFAMAMAAGKVDLSACPYVSEEARKKLAELDQPPISSVLIGAGDKASRLGGEKGAFRHEHKFESPTGLAMLVSDTLDDVEVDSRLRRFQELQYERIGLVLRGRLMAVKCESRDPRRYAGLVERVKNQTDANIVLIGGDPDMLAAGVEVCGDRRPLLHAATSENVEEVARLAKQHQCPVAARAPVLGQLAELTGKLEKLGVHDIVLDAGPTSLRQAFEQQIILRDAAVYRKDRPLGFPTMVLGSDLTDDPVEESLFASVLVAKYAGLIVLSDFQPETFFPLLLQRMGIFTDPQKELTAPEGVYEIGEPDQDSPVLLTSNWSLSFLKLSSAIEQAGVPAFMCAVCLDEEVDIMCWCDYCLCSSQRGDFKTKILARFFEKHGLKDRVKHNELIIPGKNAEFQSQVEGVLPGWEIVVGPAHERMVPAFLRNRSREAGKK